MREHRPTQCERVEKMLRTAGDRGVTNATFAQAGILRYAARIEELRKSGLSIETRRCSAGTFTYTLQTSGDDQRDRGPQSTNPPRSGPVVAGGLFAVPDERPSYMDPDAYEDAA